MITILSSSSLPPKIQGSLRKWMIEIDAGVFIGDLNPRVRAEVINWLRPQMSSGEATLIYADSRSQTGYKIETLLKEKNREIVEISGIPLVKKQRKTT